MSIKATALVFLPPGSGVHTPGCSEQGLEKKGQVQRSLAGGNITPHHHSPSTMMSWDRVYCYPPSLDEETESQRGKSLPEVTLGKDLPELGYDLSSHHCETQLVGCFQCAKPCSGNVTYTHPSDARISPMK